MRYVLVGLGNPGSEYEETRHNVGRAVVAALQERWLTSGWRDDKKLHAKISEGVTPSGVEVVLVLPDTYMNNSGGAVAPLIGNEAEAEHLIVVHDDIDLNFGTLRFTYDRGAGGHNGVASIERAIRTKAFVRLRVGVIPKTLWGSFKKPQGKERVHNFILKKMSKHDSEKFAPVITMAGDALECLLCEGRVSAMDKYNGTTTK